MIKKGFTFFGVLISLLSWSQDEGTLIVAVDSTAVKIGEQIDYILQVKADSTCTSSFSRTAFVCSF
jgi:hypothetical protein